MAYVSLRDFQVTKMWLNLSVEMTQQWGVHSKNYTQNIDWVTPTEPNTAMHVYKNSKTIMWLWHLIHFSDVKLTQMASESSICGFILTWHLFISGPQRGESCIGVWGKVEGNTSISYCIKNLVWVRHPFCNICFSFSNFVKYQLYRNTCDVWKVWYLTNSNTFYGGL